MTDRFRIYEKYKLPKDSKDVMIYQTEHCQLEARIAQDFAKSYGMIAGIEDGEDSTGRAKLRLLTPQEVATRALQVSALLVEGFRNRGWLLQLPDMKTLNPEEAKPD